MKKLMTRALPLALALGALPVGNAFASEALLDAAPCPDGYQGVVVTVDGHEVRVCENLAKTGACPPGETGITVTVASKGVLVCLKAATLGA